MRNKKKYLDHNIYGITRTFQKITSPEDNINVHSRRTSETKPSRGAESSEIKFEMDICDFRNLEMILTSIRPSKIIHLAALSESESIMKDPFETIYINGVVVCKICDILYRNKIQSRLFNTCSSEMFKGHIDYTIQDDDKFFVPTYPYSYGKILSYHMIEYYRKRYGCCFSNGILFPTESERRKSGFLMKKIKDHISVWGEKRERLKLGSLYSHRNMLHVDDVVEAICLILNQEKGDNYVISGEESNLVLDIVIKFYERHGIDLIVQDHCLVDRDTGDVVIEFEGRNGSETKIDGCARRLKDLGWKVRYNLDEILNHI